MPHRGSSFITQRIALAALALLGAISVAPEPAPAQDAGARPPREATAQRTLQALPEPRRTRHTLDLPGRTLRFDATAGAIALNAADGSTLADVAYVAYALPAAETTPRPVVFAFNGGPGSASPWLHLGTLGPWRVPLTADVISGKTRPDLIENAETWLDFADLVFIDPPGTGYSRIWPPRNPGAAPGMPREIGKSPLADDRQGEALAPRARATRLEGGPEWFWSTEGDIAAFAEFIAAWLERHGRKASPVVLAGESYGGFRAPLIAETLVSKYKITTSALILVSPVIDFDGRRGWRTPQHYVNLLPSIAATRLERTGTSPSRDLLADVETYARSDYLLDLMRGPRDGEALKRMSARVAGFSGLTAEAVAAHAARLGLAAFIEASPDLVGRGVSIYDAGMTGLERTRTGRRGGFADPFTAGLDPPLTQAMGTLHTRLEWRPDRPYVMLSNETNRRWRWPNSPNPPQAVSTLHNLLLADARLRTLITHGFTDLVTPYFATALQLDQMPAHGTTARVAFEVYPGGHMFYSRDASRARFRADAERLIGEALGTAARREPGERRETP